jgi:hypothetical protein
LATVESFRFWSGTNLLSSPILRFRPQTILPDTPDELYCDTQSFFGQIALPFLDSTNGPIYNGKSVLIALRQDPPSPPAPPAAPNQLSIILWDQYGGPIPFLGTTLVAYGEAVSVAAFWDANTMTGQWILTRIA